jgi:hypothetical protein
MNILEFQWNLWRCRLVQSRYAFPPHPIALILDAATTQRVKGKPVYEGEQIAVATVFVEGANLAAGEVLIKSWGENEGMATFLQQLGVIGAELRRVPTGFVEATVHKLLCPRR